MHSTIMPTYGRKPVCFTKGKGVWLTDKEGNTYMDMVSGVAVNALGHSSPVIVDALVKQGQNLSHVSNLYWSEPQLELSKLLIDLSNGVLKDVFFCNSGTEALEGALKLAKKFGKLNDKKYILYMENGFHGRSLGALAITGQIKYQEPFGSMLPSCIQVSFNDEAALEEILNLHCGDIAAIFVEPIQGEGGILPIQKDFLKRIEAYCTKYDSLLVFDEVQCGAGRTGYYYAFEALGVKPDIVCMAKGLGGGIPIGALLANDKASVFTKGDHGSTYGGNPLSCAVALAVTKEISQDLFLKAVSKKGLYFKAALENLKAKGKIKDYRGEGLLLGMVVKEPEVLVEAAFNHKLLLVSAGKEVVRLLPPLNVTYGEIDMLFEKLEGIL